MNIFDSLRSIVRDQVQRWSGAPFYTRARPAQDFEAKAWMYAPGSVSMDTMAQYALSAWVYTAIHAQADLAMPTPLHIVSRTDPTRMYDNHPLLNLIGIDGQPNDAQDSMEFWNQHYIHLDLAGNVYWYWHSTTGGAAPDEVYILDPTAITIKPGRDRTIGAYEYQVHGKRIDLSPLQVSHFKRANPYSIYYGMSAVDVLRTEIQSDRSMALWNKEYFTAGAPSGILVVPESVADDERDRVEAELNAKHSTRRRAAVVRSKAGSTVWLDAALKHHDLDFKDGRLLSRQAVFDALGMHVGLLSEASTEAHARVAERRVLHGIWVRQQMTASRLGGALPFWSGASSKRAQFEDVRVIDWAQEKMKLEAVGRYMTIDEVRGKFLSMAPMSGDTMPLPQTNESEVVNVDSILEGR